MFEPITDYITGKEIDNVGAEASRQVFEKFLVDTKGFARKDIQVDLPLTVQFKGEDYHAAIDLLVSCNGRPFMAITCVAGSIGSYEREILAGARLVSEFQIPYAVSTDGRNAVVLNTLTGKTLGEGLDAIPSREEAEKLMQTMVQTPLDPSKRSGEMIIFRSFNLEKINK